MGHLMMTNFNSVPSYITDFVYSKAKLYLMNATDKKTSGARFYILKPHLEKKWTYICGIHCVTITYNVDEYDKSYMKYV